MIVLFDAIDHSLAGGEVDYALSADGVGNGATLGRVLAFSLNCDGVVSEDVQVAFGIGLLEELAALSGRGDGIKNAGIGNARLGVIGDELVSVCGDPDSWITSSNRHELLFLRP